MGEAYRADYDPPDAERDPVGNFHSTYFHVVFGHNRYALMEKIGFPNSFFADWQLTLMAGDQFCRFFAPVRRGDSVVIVTVVEEIRKSSIRFRHNVYRKSDGTHVASGYGVSIVVSLETKAAVPMPDDLRKALEGFLDYPGLSERELARP